MKRLWIISVTMFALLFGNSSVSAEESPRPSAADERHFAKKILPILQERCWACHGADEKKRKGDLDLRTRASTLLGGSSGQPGIVAGQAQKSPLMLSIQRDHADWAAMPPKESDRLGEEELTAFRVWITNGAVWPSEARIAELQKSPEWGSTEGILVKTSGGLSPEWTNRKYQPADLWAFQPIRDRGKAESIDAFLDRARQATGLKTAPPADRRTLIRRVTFDLTGLPPSWAVIQAFVNDPSDDDTAYRRVIDRLLASPHYGERMAQHWLDVTRYADSSGFANDYERGSAWRYRDYVVRSFNSDKPYDRFVREQLAGDELDESNPENLIAVGYLRMGPWELTGMEVAKIARQRFLDDVTDAVGQTFLAQPLQCCRCHDHKFDPIPTRDYYSIQAVFATTQLADLPAAFVPEENLTGFAEQKYLEARLARYENDLKLLKSKEAEAREKSQLAHPDANKKPERHEYLTPDQLGNERVARKGIERTRWQLDRYEPIAMSVYSGATREVKAVTAPPRLPKVRTEGTVEATTILTGGDPFSTASPVSPGVLSAANGGLTGTIPLATKGHRLAFARWVTSPTNPLTARVMVNRIWGWHFGIPLAGNPNNFGATGKKPTHPELLDWLATRFMEDGWSIKALHRRILLSAAYRRSIRHLDPAQLAELDPLGTNYAVFRSRRLSAEEIRDTTLCATGELNLQIGGIPCRPEMNAEVAFQPRQVMGTFAAAWQPSPRPRDRHRRSLYTLKLRGQRDPFFEAFNQPSPESSCEWRDTSTVTPQAFTLMNSTHQYDRALALAVAVDQAGVKGAAAIEELFHRVLGRSPNKTESQDCQAHWQSMTIRHQKLQFPKRVVPQVLDRVAVEENTGEQFRFREPLEFMADFVPDIEPADCTPTIRGLAEVALVLLNTNEFLTVE